MVNVRLLDIPKLTTVLHKCCYQVFCTFWVSVVVLEPWDKILWSVKQEVRLNIVIILKSMKKLSRGEKKGKIKSRDQSKKVKPAIKCFSPCLALVYNLICVYYVVWKLHSYRRDVVCSCVFLKSIFVSRTGVMVPRIRLVIEGSKITFYF